MGRMILNILLTFSQFEHELISERIRDTCSITQTAWQGAWRNGALRI
jgi:DNA invertase Pin-like site-specific DNA recombinase